MFRAGILTGGVLPRLAEGVPLPTDPAFDHSKHPDRGAIRRVLVVDDSRAQRRVLSSILSGLGYDVAEAGTGEEALAQCRTLAPDLVLSDWMMPGMNGLDFCRAFRALDRDGYGYFILLTSKSEKDEVARGFEAGADDFLTKPVNGHELGARITAGERILAMQKELSRKNTLISETLEELQLLYDSLDRDLAEAKKLQKSLAPDRMVDFGGMRIAQMLRSSGHVGGDLVGHFPIDDTRLGLFSIDVSGHGVSSALMTARLAGYLSAAAPDQNVALERQSKGGYRPLPPAKVAEILNRRVLDEMDTEHYFTMVYALADMATGTVDLVQAGHPHPVIQTRAGDLTNAGNGGLPIGLIPGASYDQLGLTLNPGDRMMVFSDGIIECRGPDKSLLGDAGLRGLLARNADLRGEALFETLLWQLGEFAEGVPFIDDISGIVLERPDRKA